MATNIESEDPNQLADEYVKEFVLDHLDVSVKREMSQQQQQPPPPTGGRQPPPIAALTSVMSPPPPPPHHHLLTPPSQQPEDYQDAATAAATHSLAAMTVTNHGHHDHHNGVLVVKQNMMYPGTPPDTPPHPGASPHHPPNHYFQMDSVPPPHPHIIQHRPTVHEDIMWLQQSVRMEPQPLDLRPNCGSDHNGNIDGGWLPPHHTTVIAGGKRLHDYVHPQDVDALSPLGISRPVSVGSVNASMSPVMSNQPTTRSGRHHAVDAISDKELVHLTVRDLNKRLHGYPRDVVVRLKQKRRTLKNRGYAQNCRTKRVNQRAQLELSNRSLHGEINRLKAELGRALQERDYYRQRWDSIRHGGNREGSDGIHSNPSSPEFM
ncbi:transcription factor MafB [Nilaparvata lugens]|uniref:transcription factor MafB n=1 Tax=Nilaparvata lugens TaxID=108931 RepID=UPI00193DB28C|nr:transcription factor MafB [Nilaparvata lugens]